LKLIKTRVIRSIKDYIDKEKAQKKGYAS